MQLTDGELSRLNAFQNKSLRRILHIPSTFIDRQQTNASMYERIRNEFGCRFEHFADTWRKTKIGLLGHILRASIADPLAQVTFKADGVTPRTPAQKRPGRPRLDWVVETYKDAYRMIRGADHIFDVKNMQHLNEVKQAAINRQGPFAV